MSNLQSETPFAFPESFTIVKEKIYTHGQGIQFIAQGLIIQLIYIMLRTFYSLLQ